MKSRHFVVSAALPLAVACALSTTAAWAAAPPVLTATNVTMPSSGNGTSDYTITGIPGAGTVTIGCLFTGTISTAKIPECSAPFPIINVTAGETVTGTVPFYPFGAAVPVGLQKAPHRSGHLQLAGLSVAGLLMLGFGFRRWARRWLVLTLLAAGTLVGAGGVSGCVDLNTAMTPGTYQYTITASYQDTASPTSSAILDAKINVIVQ
ncbi:MAG: hypothetical protein WAN35_17015 [Terracidiphilus sp.]